MKKVELKGVYTATITPVNRDRSLDTGAVKALVEYYISSGLKGTLVPSSSGEYFAMTADMKQRLTAEMVKAANGRFQILANISDSCPEVILHNARIMEDIGADAVVCQPPQFHGYSQEEMITFFNHVADNSVLPVVLYNHQMSLPTKLAVDTVIKLAAHENVIGIKDTHREPERPAAMKAALAEAGLDFTVFLGGDLSAAVGSMNGFDLLNALSAIRPDLMIGIWEAGHAGDAEKVNMLQEKIKKLVALYFCLRGGMSSSSLFSMSLRLALEKKGLCGPTSVILGFEANEADRAAVSAVLASVDE